MRCASRSAAAVHAIERIRSEHHDQDTQDALEAMSLRFGLGALTPEAKRPHTSSEVCEWFGCDAATEARMERKGLLLIADALIASGDMIIAA
jgi:hypothetical protein